jgi:hypothetical protein
MSGWKTIDTAPKDSKSKEGLGPWLMLIGEGDVAPTVAFWNGGSWEDGNGISNIRDINFTHWRKLPNPPK